VTWVNNTIVLLVRAKSEVGRSFGIRERHESMTGFAVLHTSRPPATYASDITFLIRLLQTSQIFPLGYYWLLYFRQLTKLLKVTEIKRSRFLLV
jgi:hypothetical protein